MVTDARFLALDHAMSALEPRRDPPNLRAYPSVPSADALPVTVVPSDLDNCGYCGALDRFGDFATENVRGTLIAVCNGAECERSR